VAGALLTACRPAAAPLSPRAAVAADGATPGPAEGPRAPEAAQAKEAPKLVELPLRRSASGHVLVAVELGSLGIRDFVLDTGASISVITPGMRDGLGIAADAGLVAEGRGAGGSLGEIRVVTIPHLRVGGRSYDGHTVAVMDVEHLAEKLGQPFAGILGRNFLERHVLDVDFPAGQLRLWPPDAAVSGVESLQQVGFTRFEAGGLIRVEVVLDGKVAMPAVLDLGAGRSVIDWQAATAAGRSRKSKQLRKPPEPLLGADGSAIETRVGTFAKVEVGGVSWGAPELFVADLPVFQTLGLGGEPAMVLGVDFFGRRRVVVDYAGGKLHLGSAGPTAATE
jgi:predicted aspartyl protease